MSTFRIINEPETPPIMEAQVGQTIDSQSFNFRCPGCTRFLLNGVITCPHCGQQLKWK